MIAGLVSQLSTLSSQLGMALLLAAAGIFLWGLAKFLELFRPK